MDNHRRSPSAESAELGKGDSKEKKTSSKGRRARSVLYGSWRGLDLESLCTKEEGTSEWSASGDMPEDFCRTLNFEASSSNASTSDTECPLDTANNTQWRIIRFMKKGSHMRFNHPGICLAKMYKRHRISAVVFRITHDRHYKHACTTSPACFPSQVVRIEIQTQLKSKLLDSLTTSKLKRAVSRFYHCTEAEADSDRVLDGDGGELNGADMTGEELSDRAQGVLRKGGENGWTRELPELLGLVEEFREEIFGNVNGQFQTPIASVHRSK